MRHLKNLCGYTLGVFDLGERVRQFDLVLGEFILVNQFDCSIVATTSDINVQVNGGDRRIGPLDVRDDVDVEVKVAAFGPEPSDEAGL